MSSIFRLLTAPPGVSFAHRNLPPPSNLYIGPDDFLRVLSENSHPTTEVLIRGRLLTTDRTIMPFEFRHVPLANRIEKVTEHRISEGWLLGLVVLPTAYPLVRGQTYVLAAIQRGQASAAIILHWLTAGYITGTRWLSWPNALLEDSSEGPGFLRSITGTDPAAGVEISETVPTGARWRLRSLSFVLVTSVAAGTRIPFVTLDDGANVFYRIPPPAGQGASSTQRYTLAPAVPFQAAVGGVVAMPLPEPTPLAQLWRLTTITTGLDAGDNYSAPQYEVEELIERAP